MRVYNSAASLLFNVERPHWRENDLFAALRSSLAINDVPDPPISAAREGDVWDERAGFPP